MLELPVTGVDFILCIYLSGRQIGDITSPPVLQNRPESTAELQQLAESMPDVFSFCAVTRSMSLSNKMDVTPALQEANLSPEVADSLSPEGLDTNPFAFQDVFSFPTGSAVTGGAVLIPAQKEDDSLWPLLDQVQDCTNDSAPLPSTSSAMVFFALAGLR